MDSVCPECQGELVAIEFDEVDPHGDLVTNVVLVCGAEYLADPLGRIRVAPTKEERAR